jgi:serine/threonine-protein kinase
VAEARADAIVASAQDSLVMRSGVGDALRRRGGDQIEEAALAHGRQPLGSCVATTAGGLSAKHVLHAVSAWKEVSCVGRATQRALLLAEELGHRTLALVALGTGAAKVSMATSASAMMTALRYHLTLGATRLKEVAVHLWDEASLEVFREVGRQALAGPYGCAPQEVGRPVEDAAVVPEGATWVHVSQVGGSGSRG